MTAAAFDYDALKAKVDPLLERFGRSLCLTRAARATTAEPIAGKPWLSTSKGDATTAEVAAAQTISDLTGVFLSLVRRDRDGQTVEAKTQGVLLLAADELPEEVGPDWQLVDGTRTWEIVSSAPLEPGPVLLLYRLELAL